MIRRLPYALYDGRCIMRTAAVVHVILRSSHTYYNSVNALLYVRLGVFWTLICCKGYSFIILPIRRKAVTLPITTFVALPVWGDS